MWVKICGTTSLADAQTALRAGADAIGFVFAPSKRRVEAAQVADIARKLPTFIDKVGVFHRPDVDEICAVVSGAELNAAQLHFAYDAAFVAALAVKLGPTIKLLQVVACPVDDLSASALLRELTPAASDPNLWAVLLDSSSQGRSGGTGIAFDWESTAFVLKEFRRTRTANGTPKIVLAGGLNSDNVQQAIGLLEPFGVDVVSGVEAAPGKKDPTRVMEFIKNAKDL